jgi:hypothetical protein
MSLVTKLITPWGAMMRAVMPLDSYQEEFVIYTDDAIRFLKSIGRDEDEVEKTIRPRDEIYYKMDGLYVTKAGKFGNKGVSDQVTKTTLITIDRQNKIVTSQEYEDPYCEIHCVAAVPFEVVEAKVIKGEIGDEISLLLFILRLNQGIFHIKCDHTEIPESEIPTTQKQQEDEFDVGHDHISGV